MFVETVTCSRAELDLIEAETGLMTDPPAGLLTAVAWEVEDPDEVSVLMVWETAEARGDFSFAKIMPLAQQGKVVSKPRRLTPYRVFIRG